MIKLVAIAGSLRKDSVNKKLLRAAAAVGPTSSVPFEVTTLSIAGFPVYDGDIETENYPADVTTVKDAIAGSDGLLLVTPEYNYSLPGSLKNAIDWCSRPSADQTRVFAGRPVGIIGASGPSGARLAQAAWLPVFRGLRASVFSGRSLLVSITPTLFTDEGHLADPKTNEALVAYMTEFAQYCAKLKN